METLDLTGRQRGDILFRWIAYAGAFLMIILLVSIIGMLWTSSQETLHLFGGNFLISSDWDPVNNSYGAAPYIFGTIVTSCLALLLSTPIAIGAALFVTEYASSKLGGLISFIVGLLVAIPSVGFGLWGLTFLAPFMRSTIDPFLRNTIGPIPIVGELFKGQSIGQDLLTASVILAIMILPTTVSIARAVIQQVPRQHKEAMLALPSTKWEVIRYAVLPNCWPGFIGAAMLGLGRAIGETMAVTMVIGNSTTEIKASLFLPGYTIASAIANQFTEADSPTYFSAVVELGLVLLLVSACLNILTRLLLWLLNRSRSK